MSNSNIGLDLVCSCGKKKLNLNETNWKRHISSCKSEERLKISKTCNNLTNYFSRKRDNSTVFDGLDGTSLQKSKYLIKFKGAGA